MGFAAWRRGRESVGACVCLRGTRESVCYFVCAVLCLCDAACVYVLCICVACIAILCACVCTCASVSMLWCVMCGRVVGRKPRAAGHSLPSVGEVGAAPHSLLDPPRGRGTAARPRAQPLGPESSLGRQLDQKTRPPPWGSQTHTSPSNVAGHPLL